MEVSGVVVGSWHGPLPGMSMGRSMGIDTGIQHLTWHWNCWRMDGVGLSVGDGMELDIHERWPGGWHAGRHGG